MDTPQNNTPQNNKIFSWMRRHPILSINIIVGVLFVCFMVLKTLNVTPEDRCLLKNDINACKEVCNKSYENEYTPDNYGEICRIACDNGNADACVNTCGYAGYEGDDSCSMACDKGKIPSCWRACFSFKDIKACRKACDNDRIDACAQVCNDDKDLKACKSACYDDHLDDDVRLEACARVFLLTADKDKNYC